MIVVDTYRDRRVAVLGLGRTGISAVRALVAGGAEVLAWDDDPNRRAAASELGARAVAPDTNGWKGIVALVLSPGIPLTHPEPHVAVTLADKLGAEVVGDVELFARTRPLAPIIAVTGTNGKSTTTALIAHILRESGKQVEAGANFGRPVLDFETLPPQGVYVLELSSYQIDLTTSLRPNVAALINISPDHLDRHGGMEGYVAAKRRLLVMAGKTGALVVGTDDDHSATLANQFATAGVRVTPVTTTGKNKDGIFARDGVLYRNAGCSKVILADLNGIDGLRGRHNWQNAAVAYATCKAVGLSGQQIVKGMRSFPGLAHRMQAVAKIGNVLFVNDSKATNGEATGHALASYERIYWIAGGIAKTGGIAQLSEHFSRIKQAFLIGEAARGFAETLSGQVPTCLSGDLETAVNQAFAAAQAAGGGVVLLSPACASFDQFESFEARGEAFSQYAAEIVSASKPDDGIGADRVWFPDSGPVRMGARL
jgi:UDP-N-acetylmuramoylalanine--D-glutamate ligase